VSIPGAVRSSPRRPVVITRPAAQAAIWQQALQDAGYPVLLLPLLSIHPAPDVQAVRAAWLRLQQWDALMFVSANAIDAFFAQRPADLAWPQHDHAPRAWVPGPASAHALRAAGVPGHLIDAPAAQAEQLDSESLWEQVHAQAGPGFELLVVRGGVASAVPGVGHAVSQDAQRGTGRDWLGDQVQSAGGKVDWLQAYQRGAPAWGDAEHTLAARARDDGAVWLFSSSECAAHLDALTRKPALPDPDSAGDTRSCWSGSVAVATHPRIAQAVRATGFGTVYLSRAALADVLASIESIP
jgi:uroporphyrinogen-III synthase